MDDHKQQMRSVSHPSGDRPRSNLWQKMSELLSLRERVAQAELASHKHGIGDEVSNKGVGRRI
jgi:hypothetical protein